MTRIITLASGKGGTGKTTVAANLGAALAQRGKRVIALDADVTMANLGLVLGLEGRKTTLHDVLSGGAKLSRAIYRGPAGLKVVPCGMSLNGISGVRLDLLKKVIVELASKADFLIIDGPSGLDRDMITALAAAQEVILVITPDFASLSDALKVKIIAEHLRVKPIGVLINRASGERTDLSQKDVGSTLDLPTLGVIPEDIEVRRSAAFGEPVIIRSPRSPAAKAFNKLAEDLVKQKTAKASDEA